MKRKVVKKAKVSLKAQKAPKGPKAKKLNKKDLLEFKKLVSKIKEDTIGDIKHISEDTLKQTQKEASGDTSGYSYHMADVATDAYDREFSLGLASNERKLVYELNDALKKIEDGEFGICEDCKGSIAKIRLKAVPYARLCVKCQEKREKK